MFNSIDRDGQKNGFDIKTFKRSNRKLISL